MKFLIPILFFSIFLFFSCSSVRRNYHKGSSKPLNSQVKDYQYSKDSSSNPDDDTTEQNINPDTTQIRFDSNVRNVYILTEYKADSAATDNHSGEKATENLNDEFDKATALFDKENFSEACSEFRALKNTLTTGDSLQLEACFFCSECDIMSNELKSSEKALISLLEVKNLPDVLRQRAMVRLGQVYCLEDKKSKAKRLFKEFKQKYPYSEYLPFANCKSTLKN